MRIFVAGATGAIGRRLLPLLLTGGHQVTAMTRRPDRAAGLRAAGADPVVADALDREAVLAAVTAARPEVVVHELTDLAGMRDFRKFDEGFAATNRLRTEGTDHLLAAAKAAGARRFVAQSFAGWPFKRVGGPVKDENDPLDDAPPKPVSQTLGAIRHLEDAVTRDSGIEGIALRYGGFYGPGTSLAVDPPGELTELIRKRRFPVVGSGMGIWSMIHIEDAASATAAAMERGESGVYNVVDDDPVAVSVFVSEVANAVGAKPPRHLPRWVGRLLAGEAGVVMMTEIRGASNAKAKRELGWELRHPSWRQGFREGM